MSHDRPDRYRRWLLALGLAADVLHDLGIIPWWLHRWLRSWF